MEGEPAAGHTYQQRGRRYAAPADDFRSAGTLAKVTIAFLVANVVLDAVAVLTDLQMVGLVNRAKSGEVITVEEADSLDVRMARVGLMQIAGVLITAIPFVLWFRRTYRNLGSLGVHTLRFKPGWAVGGWFVPVLGLIRPKEIANDVWRATDPSLPAEIEEPPAGGRVSPLLNGWWVAYVVSGFLYGTGTGVGRRASLDELLWESQRYAVADTISVVAGALALVVVWKMTDRMNARARGLSGGAAPTP